MVSKFWGFFERKNALIIIANIFDIMLDLRTPLMRVLLSSGEGKKINYSLDFGWKKKEISKQRYDTS